MKFLSLSKMEKKSSVDPYKVLNVPRNYTLEQLKEAYKKMALKVHPDKGGTEYLFKLVTACYRALHKEYLNKQSDKQYHELKAEFSSHAKSEPFESKRNINMDASQGRFDLDKFNHVFQENKRPTVVDTGYQEFLQNNTDVVDTSAYLQGKKLSNDAFNKQFDRVTSKQPPSKMLVKYKEPEPLPAKKSVGFTELGVEKMDDFSGENVSSRDLNYMDLKIAHTTSRIVDPKTVGATPQYRNIDDIENARSKISYTLSDEDIRYYENKKNMEAAKEARRQEALLQSDQQAALQFERLHKLMLGR